MAYDELAELTMDDGSRRYGRVILIEGDRAVLQVFEGTRGISLENVRTHFTGKPMDIALSKEMLGRVFDGRGGLSTGWVNFTRRAAQHQRLRHQPGEPPVPQKLYLHRHLRHRRAPPP